MYVYRTVRSVGAPYLHFLSQVDLPSSSHHNLSSVIVDPVAVGAALITSFTFGSATQWIILLFPHTVRNLGLPHFNILFLRWVCHFPYSKISQLSELNTVAI